VKAALIYGLKRGWEMGLSVALACLLVRPLVFLGQWGAEELFLALHGGGDMWLSY
jgi:hypothetical protein